MAKKDVEVTGNYVGLNDEPGDMFGKLMGISDELMWRYYELLSFKSNAMSSLCYGLLSMMDWYRPMLRS